MDYYKHQSIENAQSEESSVSEIEEESREFTLKFISELNEKALTPISQDVLDYYNGKVEPNYQAKDILHITDKRISKEFLLNRRMIRNKKIKKNWNFEDIILLLWFVSKYMELKGNLTCETFVLFRLFSPIKIGNTYQNLFLVLAQKDVCLNSSVEKKSNYRFLIGPNKKRLCESLLLSKLFFYGRKYGQYKWKEISEQLYENNPSTKIFRTPKQCREHWNCYLDPKLKKGPWSEIEDVKLLQNVKENKGERKWSSIKHLFEGRTENALKNRYNLLLERQKKLTPNKNENELIGEYLKSKSSTQTTINSCQESPNSDNISESSKSQKESVQEEQIFEEPAEENKQYQCQITENSIVKNAQILIKSENSSFKLSEAFEKRVGLKNFSEMIKQKSSVIDSQFNSNGRFVFMNLSSIGSIFTNEQGFYTNIVYKQSPEGSKFYSSS